MSGELVLLNFARAKVGMPLHYTVAIKLSGSITVGASAGFDSALKDKLSTHEVDDQRPDAMRILQQTVEHPFGTLKAWIGSTHFLMQTLKHVRTKISLHILAYKLKRLIAIFGVQPLIAATRT